MMLISEPYRDQLRSMHVRRAFAGKNRSANMVAVLARKLGTRDILDYGSGPVGLVEELGDRFDVRSYDPAVPGRDTLPQPADLVACIDVLEHVEPDCLPEVLGHIRGLSKRAACFLIATRPADKRLPDGRNAHLIIDNPAWWMDQLRAHKWADLGVKSVSPMELVVWATA
jgi:hypothetical protein